MMFYNLELSNSADTGFTNWRNSGPSARQTSRATEKYEDMVQRKDARKITILYIMLQVFNDGLMYEFIGFELRLEVKD